MLDLDGTTLEGGGQLIRIAVSLSALTSQPVRISRIRGNRRGTGGLKASHTAAIKFLLEACGGEADGMHVNSQELTFYPRGKQPEKVEPSEPSPELLLRTKTSTLPIKTEYNIKLQTPGSVFLIFQALYPYILYAGARADGAASDNDFPASSSIGLNITGGSNATSAPTYDYFSQVAIPNFVKLGLPRVSMQLNGRGWCTGRVQLGTVSFVVEPLKMDEAETSNSEGDEMPKIKDSQTSKMRDSPATKVPTFPNIDLHRLERGDIVQVDITVLAPDFSFEQMSSQGKSSRGRNAAKGRDKKSHRKQMQRGDTASAPGEDEDTDANEDSNFTADGSGRYGSRTPSAPHSVRRFVEEQASSLLRRAFRRDSRTPGRNSNTALDNAMTATDKGRASASSTDINLYHSEPTSHPLHIYLLLVARTSNGFRLGRDALYGVSGKGYPVHGGGKGQGGNPKHKPPNKASKPKPGDPELQLAEMIERCVSDLMFELNNGDERCLDTHMRDQVVVFQALGQLTAGLNEGQSASLSVDDEELSLHTQTAMWVCEKMLGVKI